MLVETPSFVSNKHQFFYSCTFYVSKRSRSMLHCGQGDNFNFPTSLRWSFGQQTSINDKTQHHSIIFSVTFPFATSCSVSWKIRVRWPKNRQILIDFKLLAGWFTQPCSYDGIVLAHSSLIGLLMFGFVCVVIAWIWFNNNSIEYHFYICDAWRQYTGAGYDISRCSVVQWYRLRQIIETDSNCHRWLVASI